MRLWRSIYFGTFKAMSDVKKIYSTLIPSGKSSLIGTYAQ